MMVFPTLWTQQRKRDLPVHSMMNPIIRPSQPEHQLQHQFTKNPCRIGHLTHRSLWSYKRPPFMPRLSEANNLSNKTLNGKDLAPPASGICLSPD